MNATEYVKKLNRGWNLGDTLDARPKKDRTDQETAWYNPVTTEAMIKTVEAAGFDIFRVPVTWCKQLEADYTINKDFLARVKEVVDYGYNIGMTVILNLHHEDWHFPSEENYPSASRILKKLWTQIAQAFGGYENRLIFESMNEPRKEKTPVEWTGGDEEGRQIVMRLNQDFVDTIRATGDDFPQNATRMLLVPNYAASCEEVALVDFVMPKGENLIMSLHGYIPYGFALSDDHSKNIWSKKREKPIDDLFALIGKHILSKGIPVIMGECGARKKGDNENDRAEWAKYYTQKAREAGIPCIWWDNGRLDGPNNMELFGLLDRANLSWAYPKILEAFVK